MTVGEFVGYSVEATDPNGNISGYDWSGAVSGSGQSVHTKFDGTGTRSIRVTVSDAAGNSDTERITVRVTEPERPPVVYGIWGPSSVKQGETVSFTCNASDPDGDYLTYHWNVDGYGPSVTTSFGGTGWRTVTCTVVDSTGRSSRASKTVRVYPNDPIWG